MGTRGEWARDFLRALGNPNPDAKTINFVSAWTKAEGTRAKYNPLATTLDYGENTKFNNCCGGNGVKNYKTRTQGIEASVITLRGNHEGYRELREGLIRNNPKVGIGLDTWGSGSAKVATLWALDTTDETLLSEDASAPSVVDSRNPVPFRPGTANPNPIGPDGSTNATGGYDGVVNLPESGVTGDSVKKYLKLGLGGTIGAIGFFLLGKAFIQSDAVQSTANVASNVIPAAKVVKAIK